MNLSPGKLFGGNLTAGAGGHGSSGVSTFTFDDSGDRLRAGCNPSETGKSGPSRGLNRMS